jgi:hypothetical protein
VTRTVASMRAPDGLAVLTAAMGGFLVGDA